MKAIFGVVALISLLLLAFNSDARKELQENETKDFNRYIEAFNNFNPKNKTPPFLHYGHYQRSRNSEKKYVENGSTEDVEKKCRTKVLRLPSNSINGEDKLIDSCAHANDIPSPTMSFTMKDIKVGNKWTVDLPPLDLSSATPPLLSREEAEAIPFSYQQLPTLLQLFSFSPNSPQAKAVEDALILCESPPVTAEKKFCATSFESMLDFVSTNFGSKANFKALTSIHLTKSRTVVQNYTIATVPEKISASKLIACHPMDYPYTIFGCHIDNTAGFWVSLVGENGDRIEAITICHLDTSEWSEDHPSFKEIGSKPGLTDVCHFFPGGNIVWVLP